MIGLDRRKGYYERLSGGGVRMDFAVEDKITRQLIFYDVISIL